MPAESIFSQPQTLSHNCGENTPARLFIARATCKGQDAHSKQPQNIFGDIVQRGGVTAPGSNILLTNVVGCLGPPRYRLPGARESNPRLWGRHQTHKHPVYFCRLFEIYNVWVCKRSFFRD